ncbi:MAG TPA: hypothetical protein ENF28_02280 [Proteobacteria bacterium]|nr:hypothetical protein [Pseudomonadota bacterium]
MQRSGQIISGRIHIESTGFELLYRTPQTGPKGAVQTSFIVYKNEYPDIHMLTRYLDKLEPAEQKRRDRRLRMIQHPTGLCKIGRKIRNLFNTIRDSVLEVVNLLMGRAKAIRSIVSSQSKYVGQLQQQVVSSLETAYEPLLERHIGKNVILVVNVGDAVFEYPCILMEYSVEFIEVYDVEYACSEESTARKADLIVPRSCAVVRHLAQ